VREEIVMPWFVLDGPRVLSKISSLPPLPFRRLRYELPLPSERMCCGVWVPIGILWALMSCGGGVIDEAVEELALLIPGLNLALSNPLFELISQLLTSSEAISRTKIAGSVSDNRSTAS